jgi:hypothetical protein
MALAASLLTAQTLSLPKVEVEQDPEVDFSRFHTFIWQHSPDAFENRTYHINFMWHVERQLEKKGLRKGQPGQGGDLVLRYSATLDEQVRGTPGQEKSWASGDVLTTVTFDKVRQGRLRLEMLAPGRDGRAWTASTAFAFDDKRHAEEEIRAVAIRLVSKYTARPKPAG